MVVENIDTRHGTKNSELLSRGNCFPLTGLPFNMNYFSLETDDSNWWFNPSDKHYRGFRLTHQPSMWSGSKGDFCSLRILPFTEDSEGLDVVSYDNEKSLFKPNLLEIHCPNEQLVNSLSVSEYGFVMNCNSVFGNKGLRFSFPSGGCIISAKGNEIAGFSIQNDPLNSKPLKMYFKIISNTQIIDVCENKESICIYFDKVENLELHGGTSFLSFDKAHTNIELRSLKSVSEEAARQWEIKLNKIQVIDSSQEKVQTFYHNLYRIFLFPQRAYELNENNHPVHLNKYSGTIENGYLYMNTGFWDTSRTLFPLLTILDQKEYEKMLEGFLNSYRESGYLPKWLAPEDKGSMPGNYIDSVISDAVKKGIRPDLWKELYEAMTHSDTKESADGKVGKKYLQYYKKLGYVPNEFEESVSYTLDYAFDDFCIGQVAKCLNIAGDQYKYLEQSKNYQNIFSKEWSLLVPKDKNGKFKEDFCPITWGNGNTESSSLHNSYSVFHDVQGLIDLYQDEEKFTQGLISIASGLPKFKVGSYKRLIHEMLEMEVNDFAQINIGNQPSFHFPYLFAFVKKMHYSQPLIRKLLTECFSNGFESYPGDDDNGSMSAWYIFNALGFYPFCPGTGEYLIGIPLFKEVDIKLENGASIVIRANQNKNQHQFVFDCRFNGKKSYPFLAHKELLDGCIIDFSLGCVPNPKCFDYSKMPYSVTKASLVEKQM